MSWPSESPPRDDVTPGTWRSRWLRLLLVVVAVIVLAAIGLRGRLPDPHELFAALAGAGYGWVGLAVLLQAGSIAAFAGQQQYLFAALGARIRRRRVLAITLARTAISISVPAGAAVSTGYAIREYERAGAPKELGAVTAIVSGLASIGGLALIYVGGGAALLAYGTTTSLTWRPLAIVAAGVALTAAAVVLGRRLFDGDHARERPPARHGRIRRYMQRLLASARDAWRAGAGLRGRDWWAVVGYAAVNWLTDLCCLAACTHALGLPVDLPTLAGIYLGVQIVRQVPLSPGGIGVIETALVAGLTASGATAITAAAAVLLYRMLSCWLLIPLGGAAAVVLRRPRRAPAPSPSAGRDTELSGS
ncbi:flippase-like domain-containing protein [Dactylosporangium sp. NBC_01737]|uniref:lysylphosphatidylglycerol synthase transmembrane domain-containing protein n=1 Tax=Dactylosporangium sp. NBC_01737 TaxID=2975959 RepID=UPI002E13CA0A|nr:flippase-like domain-containing protein [Dactylosporangium sp. NBC_01737]